MLASYCGTGYSGMQMCAHMHWEGFELISTARHLQRRSKASSFKRSSRPVLSLRTTQMMPRRCGAYESRTCVDVSRLIFKERRGQTQVYMPPATGQLSINAPYDD
jgi:hypothetical protein